MRKFFYSVHKWLSIPLGLFISIMCFTGAIMVFKSEIAAAFGCDANSMPFFKGVMQLHRWLFIVPENPHGGMSPGRLIMGVSAIAATLILISGIVIWWPRKGNTLKSRLSISFNRGWGRFMHDSHIALGAYAFIFLLLMSLTGPVWSFRWYRSAAVAVIGGKEGGRPQHNVEDKGRGQGDRNRDWHGNRGERGGKPDRRLAHENRAEGRRGGETSANASRKGTSEGAKGKERGRERSASGRHGDGKSSPQKTFIYLHTGKWGGMVTKIIYFIAAIIGGCLPISGYYLWWKKRGSKKH